MSLTSLTKGRLLTPGSHKASNWYRREGLVEVVNTHTPIPVFWPTCGRTRPLARLYMAREYHGPRLRRLPRPIQARRARISSGTKILK